MKTETDEMKQSVVMESQRTGAEYANLEGSEIESLREERAKHYDLGRGRRQAVMYSAPVHYRSKGFIARNPGSS